MVVSVAPLLSTQLILRSSPFFAALERKLDIRRCIGNAAAPVGYEYILAVHVRTSAAG